MMFHLIRSLLCGVQLMMLLILAIAIVTLYMISLSIGYIGMIGTEYESMCIKTIYLEKRGIDVPCGRCYECVKRRRNDWYIRCLLESRHRRYTYFGLLTYKEVGSSLEKRDVQLFLKRLRSYGYQLSYLIAGEYGELRKRPHWHCLFFSDERINFSHISKAWTGGYEGSSSNVSGWIRFEPIRTARSIRYTVKYLYKYDGTCSKFELMMSKNPAIGHSFLKNHRFFLERESATFSIDGRVTAMPRYFKRKFFDDYPDIKQKVNDALAAKVVEIASTELMIACSLYPQKSVQEVKELIDYNKFQWNEQVRNAEIHQ